MIYLNSVDISTVNKWTLWIVTTLMVGFPSGEYPCTLLLSDLTLLLSISHPNPAGMELSELKYGPRPHSISGLLQCVRASGWPDSIEHLPRRWVTSQPLSRT